MNKLRALLARSKESAAAFSPSRCFSPSFSSSRSASGWRTVYLPKRRRLSSPLSLSFRARSRDDRVSGRKARSEKRRLILLNSKNTIAFRGVVTSDSVAAAQAKLIAMSNALSQERPNLPRARHPGGSVDAGMRLIDMVAGLPQKVDTITVFAASMGFHIAQHFGNSPHPAVGYPHESPRSRWR
jgi:hypothetical protein